MLAAYALLGFVPRARSEDSEADAKDWNIDTSILSYSESNRISVVEPTVKAQKDFDEDRALNLSLTIDTISGVTPIGTLPKAKPSSSSSVETIAASSGGGVAGAAGGSSGVTIDVPTAYMSDVRYGVSSSWEQPILPGLKGKLGGDLSLEKDYRSAGMSLLLAKDLNKKNTTLALGVSPEFDRSNPHGGVPVPLAVTSNPESVGNTSATKDVLSFIGGLTQIINRQTIMQWNYSQTKERGTLSDPYKLISRIDPLTGDPIDSLYEARPRSRLERSYYWLTKYHLGFGANSDSKTSDVMTLAYRYYTDDWGIKSHTADLNYRWVFSSEGYFEPRFRFYHQSQANFYRIGLFNGDPLPEFVSADYRLAKFDAYTIGARFGYKIGEQTALVLRFDYYTQIGNSHPDSAVGIQKGFDLYPALQALIFQAQLSFQPSHLIEDFSSVFR